MTEQEKKKELARLERAWEEVNKRQRRYQFIVGQLRKQKSEIEKAIKNL